MINKLSHAVPRKQAVGEAAAVSTAGKKGAGAPGFLAGLPHMLDEAAGGAHPGLSSKAASLCRGGMARSKSWRANAGSTVHCACHRLTRGKADTLLKLVIDLSPLDVQAPRHRRPAARAAAAGGRRAGGAIRRCRCQATTRAAWRVCAPTSSASGSFSAAANELYIRCA